MPKILLNVSHHRQRPQSAECLPACVAMALDYLGRPVEYDALVSLLHARFAVGTAAANVRHLETLGVNVRLFHADLDAVREALADNWPVIAFVETTPLPHWSEETDHTVLIVGMDDEAVYVNDPEFDQAPQRVPRIQFELAWLRFDNLCAVITD
jgi:ABC-type bacteriocin/lantibiotic exporter with double-glycine peptidase domain